MSLNNTFYSNYKLISTKITKANIMSKTISNNFSVNNKFNQVYQYNRFFFKVNNKYSKTAKLNKSNSNSVNIQKGLSNLNSFYKNNKKPISLCLDSELKNINNCNINNVNNINNNNDDNNNMNSFNHISFPRTMDDINLIGRQTILHESNKLEADHPGFNDPNYRKRRNEIGQISRGWEMTQPLPYVKYTQEENNVWSIMWNILMPYYEKYACIEFLQNFEILKKELKFNGKEIPQIRNITDFLEKRTGFIFRPVDGYLSPREFLNSLAFKVFSSTQYIRHHSNPHYTPEPDLIHEFLGHTAMFIDQDFCDFSQEVGLASIGVSDEEIEKLAAIYMFTVEFGLCLENNKRKIYGAGIISCPNEVEWCMLDKPGKSGNMPTFHDFDLEEMIKTPYFITELQKHFFITPSIKNMKEEVIKYTNSIKRPFKAKFNKDTRQIII